MVAVARSNFLGKYSVHTFLKGIGEFLFPLYGEQSTDQSILIPM